MVYCYVYRVLSQQLGLYTVCCPHKSVRYRYVRLTCGYVFRVLPQQIGLSTHDCDPVQYRSINPQFLSNRQNQRPCRTPAGITQTWTEVIQAEWASQDFYTLLPEHSCNRASSARVAVTLAGEAVPGSPFAPAFRSAGAVDPRKSLAHYTATPTFFGFHAGDAALSAVTVSELRDEFGNAFREPPAAAELFYMPPLQLVRDFSGEVLLPNLPEAPDHPLRKSHVLIPRRLAASVRGTHPDGALLPPCHFRCIIPCAEPL